MELGPKPHRDRRRAAAGRVLRQAGGVDDGGGPGSRSPPACRRAGRASHARPGSCAAMSAGREGGPLMTGARAEEAVTLAGRAARSAAVRLGQPDPGRAGRRRLGRRQADQPADRRAGSTSRGGPCRPTWCTCSPGSTRLPRPARHPGHPPPPVAAAPAPVAPAEDSALPGELPRGAYRPGTVRSPSADRRKQRFTAQPGSVRRRRDPPDGGCLMLPRGGTVKTMSPREGDGRRGQRRLIVTEEL